MEETEWKELIKIEGNEALNSTINFLEAVKRSATIKISRSINDFFADRIKYASSAENLFKFGEKVMESMQSDIKFIGRETAEHFFKICSKPISKPIQSWLGENYKIAALLCTLDVAAREDCMPDLNFDSENYKEASTLADSYTASDFDIGIKATCLSPLSHGADNNTGNSTLFRRMQVLSENGGILELPFISGNSIRGQMRDLLADHLLTSLGLSNSRSKPVINMWFFHAIYSGGSLSETSKEEKAIEKQLGTSGFSSEGITQIRNFFPALSLLGWAFGNKILSGRMQVNDLRPRCKEWGYPESPTYQKLLSWYYLTRQENFQGVKDEKGESMIANTECLIPGTTLEGGIDISDHLQPLEAGALLTGLKLLKEHAYIGGGNRQGWGKIDLDYSAFKVQEDDYPYYLYHNKSDILKFMESIGALAKEKQDTLFDDEKE
jgi:CRISPR/Cas system CSM-associated protein Csm3 (group 7 of RAMP superfamily)